MVYLIYIFNDPAVLELGVSTGAAALQWEKMRIESTNFGEMKRQVVVGDLVGFRVVDFSPNKPMLLGFLVRN